MSKKIKYDTINEMRRELDRTLHTDRDEIVKGKYTFDQYPNNLGLNELVNASLDRLPQLMYRNLEGDNMLASSNFGGRVRAVETPMQLVYKNGTEVIINNMPYIAELIARPSEWMLGYAKYPSPDPTGTLSRSINSSIKILEAEYVGDYETHSNCYRLILNKPLWPITPTAPEIGQRMFVCSFLANGIELKWEPAFKSSQVNGDWNHMVTSVGAIWKHSDGTFRAIVGGYTARKSNGDIDVFEKRYTMKLFRSDTRFGTWTNMGDEVRVGVFNDLLPVGFLGYAQAAQTIPHPTKKGSYLMAIGLYSGNQTASLAMGKMAILEFDEDLRNRRLIEITHDYTFSIYLNSFGYGNSIAYYKGEYLICMHDGTHITGKRIVLASKNLEGPYTLHSTVFDWAANVAYKQGGSMLGNSVANSTLYVYNNELYCFTSGEGTDTESGNAAKHQSFLFKYNDKNGWNFVKGPVLLSLHGDWDNYPEISPWISYNVGSPQHEYGGWGSAHLGQMNFFEVEDGKLWMAYGSSGWGQHPIVSYQTTIGYIDLRKALK